MGKLKKYTHVTHKRGNPKISRQKYEGMYRLTSMLSLFPMTESFFHVSGDPKICSRFLDFDIEKKVHLSSKMKHFGSPFFGLCPVSLIPPLSPNSSVFSYSNKVEAAYSPPSSPVSSA